MNFLLQINIFSCKFNLLTFVQTKLSANNQTGNEYGLQTQTFYFENRILKGFICIVC